MSTLIVVSNPKDWPLEIPGVTVVPARAYLTDPAYNGVRNAKVFNLCRDYRYQSSGYYVSLLAAARGHRPLPGVSAIQDLKSQAMVRILSEELDELIQRTLKPLHSESFTLHIYFGRSLAKRYDALSLRLFNLFQAPLLIAQFNRFGREKKWQLQGLRPIALSEIPWDHGEFVMQVAAEHFAGRGRRVAKRAAPRYDLAILYDPADKEPPSSERSLRLFTRAAESLGFAVELITKDDYGRLAEFDALFVRETTSVNHHTYRFARRAAAEGLVVIDDPDSILKCTNKVYLHELMARHGVPTPKTLVVHKENVREIVPALGLPCVLKQPDSSFSQGVVKVDDAAALKREVTRLLDKSDLIVAQEFLPTAYDWRVGIIDRKILYVCKYFMARRHWQIIKRDAGGRKRDEGESENLPLDQVPQAVLRTALKAANLIGDGLYGVDLKQVGRRCYLIEVNDNPSIDAGVEDTILGADLYKEIMRVFLERVERRKAAGQ